MDRAARISQKAKTGARVLAGAQILKNRSTDEVGRFLSSIQFESKGILEELGVKIDKNP